LRNQQRARQHQVGCQQQRRADFRPGQSARKLFAG
jgi:hypothetical protein